MEDVAEEVGVSVETVVIASLMTLNIVRGRRVNGREAGQDGGHGGGLPVHQDREDIRCPDTRGGEQSSQDRLGQTVGSHQGSE